MAEFTRLSHPGTAVLGGHARDRGREPRRQAPAQDQVPSPSWPRAWTCWIRAGKNLARRRATSRKSGSKSHRRRDAEPWESSVVDDRFGDVRLSRLATRPSAEPGQFIS